MAGLKFAATETVTPALVLKRNPLARSIHAMPSSDHPLSPISFSNLVWDSQSEPRLLVVEDEDCGWVLRVVFLKGRLRFLPSFLLYFLRDTSERRDTSLVHTHRTMR